MKKRSPEQLQAEYEADMKKFAEKGVALDDDGKYLLYILHEDEPDDTKVYFFDKKYRRVRIYRSTFYRLLDEGKAVRVSPEDI